MDAPTIADTPQAEGADELRKEALTMALYVAICLLAALAAVSEATAEEHVFALIWGTTLGLALAHWFAFQVSARFVAQGHIRRHDALAAVAQLIGALAVALLATAPIVVLPASVELDVVKVLLACFVALVGYGVARSAGAGTGRSMVYAVLLVIVASGVVAAKIALGGH
jgi:hypothetical protein